VRLVTKPCCRKTPEPRETGRRDALGHLLSSGGYPQNKALKQIRASALQASPRSPSCKTLTGGRKAARIYETESSVLRALGPATNGVEQLGVPKRVWAERKSCAKKSRGPSAGAGIKTPAQKRTPKENRGQLKTGWTLQARRSSLRSALAEAGDPEKILPRQPAEKLETG